MRHDVGIRRVEEPALQPVHDADRVERYDDLLVVVRFVTQASVEFQKVFLVQLRRFFDPDRRDAVNGLQLFRVVQSGEDDRRFRILDVDDQIALVAGPFDLRIILIELPAELGKAGVPQRPRNLSTDQDSMPLFGGAALQYLPACEDGFSGTRAAHQYQIPRFTKKERQKRLVVRFNHVVPPLCDGVFPFHVGFGGIVPLPRRQLVFLDLLAALQLGTGFPQDLLPAQTGLLLGGFLFLLNLGRGEIQRFALLRR